MAKKNSDEAPWHHWLKASRRWHMIDEIDLVGMVAEQCQWLGVSMRLEDMADCLPAALPAAEVVALRRDLARLVEKRQDFTNAMTSLLGDTAGEPLAAALLAHIEARRAARADQAQDVSEALDPAAAPASRLDPQALGYMLRCLFDGCRQIVALERLAILKLGGARLTVAARTLLAERIIDCCDAPAADV